MFEQQGALPPQRVVVLGASGMLGSELVVSLGARQDLVVRGTVRSLQALPPAFVDAYGDVLVPDVDVTDRGSLEAAIGDADVVINAVGVIKQATGLDDRVGTVALNALLPQQLALACEQRGARFVHISTDCVFSGRAGSYTEDDVPDPVDFYGRSKLLGEVVAPALTLRTSIIGHELQRHASLVDWFLTQPQTHVRGFVNAIYSGVTTFEIARLLHSVIVDHPELSGLYHVASAPISKLDLLGLVAKEYGWSGDIVPFDDFHCDRSMTASRLADATGYVPPTWPDMIREMYANRPTWAVSPVAEGTLA